MSSAKPTSASSEPAASAIEVSFAVACFNGLPHLPFAVQSALAQRDVEVEVIVVDDGSKDGSLDCIRSLAAADQRIRLLQTPVNMGPGGARNLAIEAMQGRWLAILDADDLVEPGRSRRLIDAAEMSNADLVADDLVLFGDGIAEQRFLSPGWPKQGGWMTFDRYLSDAILFGSAPNPGFLKPIIRRSLLDSGAVRYNPDLRIGEDDELIMRLLHAGARYLILPEPGYRYRKHGASISHRLSPAHCDRMVQSETCLRRKFEATGALPSAYRRRWRALLRAQAFVQSIDQLKHRKFIAAAHTLLASPTAVWLYRMPLRASLSRLISKRPL